MKPTIKIETPGLDAQDHIEYQAVARTADGDEVLRTRSCSSAYEAKGLLISMAPELWGIVFEGEQVQDAPAQGAPSN